MGIGGRYISGVSWNTKIGELEGLAAVGSGAINVAKIPDHMSEFPLKRLVYLGGEVQACLCMDYLKGKDTEVTIREISKKASERDFFFAQA